MKPEKLRDLLRSVLRDNPRASEAEARQLCWQRCETDAEIVQALFDYWFGNSFRDFKVIGGTGNSTAVISIKQQRQSGTREAINKLKGKFLACLMDHALSDGTMLRHATFGQCTREGSWLAAIGKAGKPNEIVGKKLTEADLRNLAKRFWKERHEKAA